MNSLMVVVVGIACDGGTDTSNPDASNGGVDAVVGGGSDAPIGGGVDASIGGNPDAMIGGGIDAGSEGACVNSADQTVMNTQDVDGATTTCGNNCLFDNTPNCVRDCVVTATGLSEPCAGCFDGLVNCMITNCAFQCIDSGSVDCETCRLANCATPFADCSGL